MNIVNSLNPLIGKITNLPVRQSVEPRFLKVLSFGTICVSTVLDPYCLTVEVEIRVSGYSITPVKSYA